jgi:hypothetical protein
MSGPFRADCLANEVCNFTVTRTISQQGAYVELVRGEETRTKLPI